MSYDDTQVLQLVSITYKLYLNEINKNYRHSQQILLILHIIINYNITLLI